MSPIFRYFQLHHCYLQRITLAQANFVGVFIELYFGFIMVVGPTAHDHTVHGVPGMLTQHMHFLEQTSSRHDWHRRQGADPRDPRCVGGVCGGRHMTLIRRGNQHAAWYSCKRCKLRVLYVPRVAASGRHRALGPMPADQRRVPAPPQPTMPFNVDGMMHPQASQVQRSAGPRRTPTSGGASSSSSGGPTTAPTATSSASGPTLAPATTSSASCPTPAPEAAPVAAAAAATPAAPETPQPDQGIVAMLGRLMQGIQGLSHRMDESDRRNAIAAAHIEQAINRVTQLEERATATEHVAAATAHTTAQVTTHLGATAAAAHASAASAQMPLGQTTMEHWHLPSADPDHTYFPESPISSEGGEVLS